MGYNDHVRLITNGYQQNRGFWPMIINSLSLSGGTQSVYLALRFSRGEIEGFACPDIMTFADTFDERHGTYKNIEIVERECKGIPLIKCGSDNHNVATSFNCQSRAVKFPFFTKNPLSGKGGAVSRQCTTEFKILPIKSAILDYLIGRELAFYTANGRRRVTRGVKVVQYIGFTAEEFTRVKPHKGPRWLLQDYPLLALGVTKADCVNWLQEHYPQIDVNGSSCIRCPYTASMNLNIFTPDELRTALEADYFLDSEEFDKKWKQKLGFTHDMFLTDHRVRLSELVGKKIEDTEMSCHSGHCFL